MRDVVSPMPRVKLEQAIEVHRPVLRMHHCPGKLLGLQRSEENRPSRVERFQQNQGGLDGREFGINQFRPKLLFVWFDRWVLFCHSQLASDVGVDVTIGQVMDLLPACPPAFAVWHIELLIRKAMDRLAELLRHPRDLIDERLTIGVGLWSVSDRISPKDSGYLA